MKNRSRTEDLNLEFIENRVKSWAFHVGDFFRDQLDIKLDKRMDLKGNSEKKRILGRPLRSNEKIFRNVWTQGVPPAYSFQRGHIFHEVRSAEIKFHRSIVILFGKPDPGALFENDLGEITFFEEHNSYDKNGYVEFEILTYENEIMVTNSEGVALKSIKVLSQKNFVDFLRTGILMD